MYYGCHHDDMLCMTCVVNVRLKKHVAGCADRPVLIRQHDLYAN